MVVNYIDLTLIGVPIFRRSGIPPSEFAERSLQWRHNERDGISNHRRLHCLLNCWFRRRPKKTSKLRVTGLCEGNSPVTGEFRAQKTSNAENVSIWWRHHVKRNAVLLQVQWTPAVGKSIPYFKRKFITSTLSTPEKMYEFFYWFNILKS